MSNQTTTAAIAGAANQVLNTASNVMAVGNVNRRAVKHANEMWDKQGQRELQYWHMQNAYNDPSAQMQRLKDAGLNPHLVYGSGATTEAASLSPRQAQSTQFKTPTFDGNVVHSALLTRQALANIAKTEAETNAVNTRTYGIDFENQVKDLIGVDNIANAQFFANQALEAKSQKELALWETFMATGYAGKDVKDPNSPIAKAMSAGWSQTIQDAENAMKLGAIRDAEAAIKAFEVRLTKQGISPNSPWYVKIITDLATKIIGLSPSDVGTMIGSSLR